MKSTVVGISWIYPRPSNSHQQGYYIFSWETWKKPSLVTIASRVVDQRYKECILKISYRPWFSKEGISENTSSTSHLWVTHR